ncbi:MAG TPA: beta-L-arabinofuranosidase domain-containing protein [Blastocatellia bacterium]|nr:beta-L-arabinofuranosidase domain-containing protein [Blastocatellia bacterium]
MTRRKPARKVTPVNATRRALLRSSACAFAAATVGSLPDTPTQGKEVVHEFPFGTVRLTGGLLKQQFDRIQAHYLSLSNDRLLKVFRQRVGLPAPGADMGGWYDANGFVPGLTLGQYISGLARLGAATGDQACHDKARALVAGFGEFLARTDNPYAGAGAEKMWPAYVMDKYVVGLVDAYRLSGVEQAKKLLPEVIAKCRPFISPVSKDRIGKKDPPYDETYVLSENLFAAAEITGDQKYYDLAVHYLLDREWFDPLAAGQDVLPTKHAYSHTIALSSGGQAYLATGNPKYKKALENAWRFMEAQRFASGGWGPEEQFVEPGQGKLRASLSNSEAHFETPCGAYADLKLARYLLRFTGHPRYGDGLERTLYNTILATRLPDSDGGYPYYSNYKANAVKKYYHRKWPCCSGTLVQGVADYVRNIYFHDHDALYVNLFTPSTVVWKRPGDTIELEQVTNYPAENTSRLRIHAGGKFTLKIRIPAWTRGATVRVNGRAVAASAGEYAVLTRHWQRGDVVEIVVPQPLRTLPIESDHTDVVALLRGAMLYVGLNPWAELEQTPIALPAMLQPMGGRADSYVARVAGRELVFVPYYEVQLESYQTYFKQA